jgi:hypothetical protein
VKIVESKLGVDDKQNDDSDAKSYDQSAQVDRSMEFISV